MAKRPPQKRVPKLYIREWMARARLNQAKVARRMGVTEGTVSKLLKGGMEMKTQYLAGFAEAIGSDIEDLFHDPARPSAADLLRHVPPDKLHEVEEFIRFKMSRK